jgi:spore coat polysaccharide biosynthesis protein SpsF
MGSTRLPGKILKEVAGVPLLQYEIERLRQAAQIDRIVVATSTEPEDDATEALCRKIGVDCFRGDLEDVLDRYYKCALRYPDYASIMRITGDCPLIDPDILDSLVVFFKSHTYEYASNIELGRETYPDGMDAEIFTREALVRTAKEAKLPSEREHVTLRIRNECEYTKGHIQNPTDYSSYRLTVDNPEDLEVVSFLIIHTSPAARLNDYIDLLEQNHHIKRINMSIERNEGLQKSLKEDKDSSI